MAPAFTMGPFLASLDHCGQHSGFSYSCLALGQLPSSGETKRKWEIGLLGTECAIEGSMAAVGAQWRGAQSRVGIKEDFLAEVTGYLSSGG